MRGVVEKVERPYVGHEKGGKAHGRLVNDIIHNSVNPMMGLEWRWCAEGESLPKLSCRVIEGSRLGL